MIVQCVRRATAIERYGKPCCVHSFHERNPAAAWFIKQKTAQTYCLHGTNTKSIRGTTHVQENPALCASEKRGVLHNENAPRRLLLTKETLRVRPPSEVHSLPNPLPRSHRAAALCTISLEGTPLHLRFNAHSIAHIALIVNRSHGQKIKNCSKILIFLPDCVTICSC